MKRPRYILHADMDAFFASVEQRENPELRGKPVIVGASSARGVVAAASYEARVYGVRSAMPGFRARQLCPHGIFLPSNMRLYARVSDEVHSIFETFTPQVQPIALDEAFLDISGSVELFGGPVELGYRLKRAVREQVGLPISVGIAGSKLVAKLACTFGKPDGLLYVPPEAVTWFLSPLPVRRLWGVGPVLERTLRKAGYDTVGQLSRANVDDLRRVVGDRAPDLIKLARGEDHRAVEAHAAPKSYGEENTFERDVVDREVVTAALTSHAEAVARRLRRDGYKGRTVTLKIKLARRAGTRESRLSGEGSEPIYPILTRSKTLPSPTSDGAIIRDVAVALWDSARLAEPVRLLGVSLSNLAREDAEQLDLFAPKPRGRDRLGPALDAIADKFGRGAIRRAVDDPQKITATHQRKRGEDRGTKK